MFQKKEGSSRSLNNKDIEGSKPKHYGRHIYGKFDLNDERLLQ